MTTVLLVDDDPHHRGEVEGFLRQHGCHVVTATDGSEGLLMAEVVLPDVVLMDASLPSLDGWTAAARIRRAPGLEETPVVVLTDGDLPEHRAMARATGAAFSLPKPTPLPEVLEVVMHCTSRPAAPALPAS